MPLQADTIHSH